MRYNVVITRSSTLEPVQISFRKSQLPINLGSGSGQPRFDLGESALNRAKPRQTAPNRTSNEKVLRHLRKSNCPKVETFPSPKFLQLATNCRKLPKVAGSGNILERKNFPAGCATFPGNVSASIVYSASDVESWMLDVRNTPNSHFTQIGDADMFPAQFC
jgi:hypothetical protein